MGDMVRQPSPAEAGPSVSQQVIDTHIHLWDTELIDYPWLVRWPHLGARVCADDLVRAAPSLAGAVLVEASALPGDVRAELNWLVGQAAELPFPTKIVVQSVPEDPQWWSTCAGTSQHVAGVRQVMHHQPAGAVAGEDFRDDARLAGEADLAVHLTIRRDQLPEVPSLCRSAPDTLFVLDHLGKPATHEDGFAEWTADIRAVARHTNVICKLSGAAVQSGRTPFDPDRTLPYLELALAEFGADRCMYGTDWPVVTHVSTLRTWLDFVVSALSTATAQERDSVLRRTALRVYRFADPS
jgi:L-fuconolactonase